MEPFDFAVGLGSAGSGLFDSSSGCFAGAVPVPGSVTRSVVGDDPLAFDPDCFEPSGCSLPEVGSSFALLIVEDLRIDNPGTVVQSGVNVSIPSPSVFGMLALVTLATGPPSTTLGDTRDLLDINMDQLTRVLPLIPVRRGLGSSITPAKSSLPGSVQNRLDCRGRYANLMGNVIGAPASFPPQPNHSAPC